MPEPWLLPDAIMRQQHPPGAVLIIYQLRIFGYPPAAFRLLLAIIAAELARAIDVCDPPG